MKTKFGQKFQSHRYIYMKSLRTMHSNFIKTSNFISISTFYRLRPFYVFQPALRETETCGCMNAWTHIMYIIQSKGMTPKMIIHLLKLNIYPETSNAKKNKNINYGNTECINGNCQKKNNNSKLPLNKDIPHSTETKLLTYYVFETAPTNYYYKMCWG